MSMKYASTAILLFPLALVPACVSSKKPKKDTAALVNKLVIDALPDGVEKLNSRFDGKITLAGYELTSKGKVKPGDTVTYKLYWRSEKPLGDNGWKLFTHVLNSDKRRLLNIDQVGDLRSDSAPGPSKWQAGKIYVDEQSFKVPDKTEGEELMVTVGVWKKKKRLKLQSGASAGEDRAVALKVTVAGAKAKKRPSTRVPQMRIDKLEKGAKIKIDGKLDEAVWGSAATTGKFVNVRKGKPDASLPVQGDAKLLWDDDGLYVGVTVSDKDIVGGFDSKEKDPHLWTKDCVEIMIDPDGDGDNKDYYEIQINPQNLVFDSQFDDYNKPNGGENGPFGHQDWSAKLQSAVTVDGTLDKPGDEDKGYVVEVKIPWKSLAKAKQAPPALGDKWRMNIYAMQNNGGVAWSPILGQGNFHKASRFGKVTWAEKGWEPPKKGKPTAAKAEDQATPEGQAKGESGKAVDVKAGLEAKSGGKVEPRVNLPSVLPKAATPQLRKLEPAKPSPAPSAAPAAPVAPKP